ncbi:EAL domain-containing protein [Caulobacter vibrioides]|uniref:putative bifunctional diguanylate cyclase/phosphodiesterase n=1 Tax=Caulobacter vibrioides TaxID=155892 RepID=UPI000BB51DC4|nr:EAL domain-containing protein [Caulobacter vibrioides]ATC25982.1 PAS domain S-box protein [Caulobacter vibrioides]AZH14122.1 EAL domain-containing protein [Caulobacter vibrioides]PLR16377.1 PAS domain S-box protein [Caulobacter vibrioides]
MFTLRDTVSFLEPAREDHLGKTLYDRFREEPDTLIIPVLDADNRPIGLVERNAFFLRMAAEYGRALYANRPISTLMDREPLVVDAEIALADFTTDSLSYRASDLLRGFIVTEAGRYLGVGTVLALLQAANETNRRGVEALALAKAEVERAQTFMTGIVEAMPAMVFVKRADDHSYVLLNRAGEKTLGFKRDEVIGKTDADIHDAELAALYRERDRAVLDSGEVRVIEEDHVPRKDGGTAILRTKKIALLNAEGRAEYLLGVSEDIAERKRAEAQIARLAHYDPLTDLPNRVLFQKSLGEALARRSRKGDALAVHFVDLDRFKTVNDTLGHPLGDALLKIAAERLRGCVREGDTVARLGGDEFAIVQTGLDDSNGATRLAARIVEAMAAPFDLQGHHVVIGASVGVSLAPTDGDDADELLKKADMALYRAKADGRGAYHFFERAMDEQLQARRALELDLRRALQAGEFELFYQPLYHLGDERVTGCEALLRWRHPERGMVSPADFIPLAEEIGLIVQLGEWVLRRACAEAANWPEHVRLAVNLSPAQFRDRGLVRTVVSALAASGLPAQRLELEITESVLLQDSQANMTMLHDLKALGVRISMDDFGTGYSSLSYLRSFPFDKIKIDQTFVRDILHDSDAMAIIKAVLDLGASMGVVTTAEGVETQAQLDALRQQGCAEIQGYFISRPAPASEIAKMLGVTGTSAAEPPTPVTTLSQREKEGPAPQAWEDEGLKPQTDCRHAG